MPTNYFHRFIFVVKATECASSFVVGFFKLQALGKGELETKF